MLDCEKDVFNEVNQTAVMWQILSFQTWKSPIVLVRSNQISFKKSVIQYCYEKQYTLF